MLTDQPGENSWPITGASYIIIHKKQTDKKIADAMIGFFDWSYKHGADMAKKLNYVPMPDSVIKMVKTKWKSVGL